VSQGLSRARRRAFVDDIAATVKASTSGTAEFGSTCPSKRGVADIIVTKHRNDDGASPGTPG